MKIKIIIVTLIVVGFIILLRNHIKWLASQNPIGTWTAQENNKLTVIEFEGGPKEGTYKQLIETDKSRIKEFGQMEMNPISAGRKLR